MVFAMLPTLGINYKLTKRLIPQKKQANIIENKLTTIKSKFQDIPCAKYVSNGILNKLPERQCSMVFESHNFKNAIYQNRNLKKTNQLKASNKYETKTVSSSSETGKNNEMMKNFKRYADMFTSLFPVWLILTALVAVWKPNLFLWLTTDYFTLGLAILMFSMGITLTIEDFIRVSSKPGPVAINFISCYLMMPILGMFIGKILNLSEPFCAGLILVGATNGGQASNLCTYIARADVALSVLMTTSTTLGCLFATPLICKYAIGKVIPIDAIGISISAIQVILIPITLGILLNKYVPKFCRTVEPFSPILGVVSTIFLVGASIAKCATPILNAGPIIQVATVALHLFGGILGYYFAKLLKYDEKTSRTTAIETSMKSSAFSFLLATLHFGDEMVRILPAVSVVWMAVIGSSLAVFWKNLPINEDFQEKPKKS